MQTSEVCALVRETSNGVTVKISIFGVAAWGFTSSEDYNVTLKSEVQKILALGVNCKELVEAYKNEVVA